ncbi:MAG: 2-oxoglutarate and iron-dependent oxygenase domain-containing protein [Verrucomicrobia bacterium]|nr:2-oxoglutarate and iron-dependent oxygenase domain-containing protein [Verrucomicrobiota bacterium]
MFKKLACIATLLISNLLNASESDQLDIRIPVVDMQDFYNPEKQDQFMTTLYGAMTQIGFFAVRNTGVDSNVVREAYAQAEQFFKKETDFKMRSFAKELNGQRGFVPSEAAKGNRAKDCKEFYHIGRELPLHQLQEFGLRSNVWPEQRALRKPCQHSMLNSKSM